jgi:hypothetical protein
LWLWWRGSLVAHSHRPSKSKVPTDDAVDKVVESFGSIIVSTIRQIRTLANDDIVGASFWRAQAQRTVIPCYDDVYCTRSMRDEGNRRCSASGFAQAPWRLAASYFSAINL